MTEMDVQDAVRLVFGADAKCLIFRNNIGQAEFKGGRQVRYGVGGPGGSDLIGCYAGRFLCVEVKKPGGKQTIEQQTFQRLVEQKGGIYRVIHSVDEVHALLAELAERFG